MSRAGIPAELSPESVTAVIDSREQEPLDLAPLAAVRGTLSTGDYSVAGLESVIAVERKSLPDLLACVGRERERFERETMRLLAYPTRAIVVEGEWADLERGDWRSQVTPAAAIGSLLGWIAQGIPIVMAGDHERAGRFVSRMLFIASRRRYRENRALLGRAERVRGSSNVVGPARVEALQILEGEGATQ
jgi:DNA excision repair protein ERCC-4